MIENISSIQFIGTQRSGSNLLRVMLNQLPQICAPHPPHILKVFFPLLPQYGNLNDTLQFNQLATDVCDWVNHNPVPWEGLRLNWVEIVSQCKERTLIELFRKIYEKKARQEGAVFWCCKSMESIYYVNEIEAAGIKPFYIYLYRDGRDVAVSFKKTIVGPKHIYSLANKWKREQDLSLALLDNLDEKRFIMVRYEDLIAGPRQTLFKICAKLDIPFSERVFDYFNSEESKNTANSGVMWRNVAKPIISTNFNKYEIELTEDEIVLFECVAGEILQKLGYRTKFWPDVSNYVLTSEQIREFNKRDELLRIEAVANADSNELARRMPQDEILSRIKARDKSIV